MDLLHTLLEDSAWLVHFHQNPCLLLKRLYPDYIFILDPPSHVSHVVGLLKPHITKDMEPGLPQKDVCGSDHVSLVSEIVWTSAELDTASQVDQQEQMRPSSILPSAGSKLDSSN